MSKAPKEQCGARAARGPGARLGTSIPMGTDPAGQPVGTPLRHPQVPEPSVLTQSISE